MAVDVQLLQDAIKGFSERSILVIGDIILDQYTFGKVNRISPEAPVPILKRTRGEYRLGGAANVAYNAKELGAQVGLIGFVGNDDRRPVVQQILKSNDIDASGILIHENKPTVLKHRFVDGFTHQLLRVDDENKDNLTPDQEEALVKKVQEEIKKYEVVIFSDYDKGLFSKYVTAKLIEIIKEQKKPILADFKPSHRLGFKGVDVITPNLNEGIGLTHLEKPAAIGAKLVADFDCDIILTMGGKGMYGFSRKGPSYYFPAQQDLVVDVSGAGDTVIAVSALMLADGADFEHMVYLANKAGGAVVQKPGVATLSGVELTSILIAEEA